MFLKISSIYKSICSNAGIIPTIKAIKAAEDKQLEPWDFCSKKSLISLLDLLKLVAFSTDFLSSASCIGL